MILWGKGPKDRLEDGVTVYGSQAAYYCDRVYTQIYQPSHPNRKQFVSELQTNKELGKE